MAAGNGMTPSPRRQRRLARLSPSQAAALVGHAGDTLTIGERQSGSGIKGDDRNRTGARPPSAPRAEGGPLRGALPRGRPWRAPPLAAGAKNPPDAAATAGDSPTAERRRAGAAAARATRPCGPATNGASSSRTSVPTKVAPSWSWRSRLRDRTFCRGTRPIAARSVPTSMAAPWAAGSTATQLTPGT